ncbi:hypothetical protein CaCOL14_007595 [Colletotrichum acutatum]
MRVKLLKFTEMSEGDEGNLRLAFSSFTESQSVFITSIITCFTHLTNSGVSTTTTHTTSFLPFRNESEANRIFSCSRLARRGGVKRISAMVYDDVRSAMKTWLESVLTDCVTYVEHRKTKTVRVTDVSLITWPDLPLNHRLPSDASSGFDLFYGDWYLTFPPPRSYMLWPARVSRSMASTPIPLSTRSRARPRQQASTTESVLPVYPFLRLFSFREASCWSKTPKPSPPPVRKACHRHSHSLDLITLSGPLLLVL